MKPLDIPNQNELLGDPKSVELVRFWVGRERCHIALNIGVWHDSGDSEVDELTVWSNVISDITRHVANAMSQRYDMSRAESIRAISSAYIKNMATDDESIRGE